MKSTKIIDSRLFIRFPPLEDPTPSNIAFQSDARNKGHLGSQLLLYETIAIPTLDMGIVPILINWLGVNGFEETINHSAFQFLRYPDAVGYAGNGNGLCTFDIELQNRPPAHWWMETVWGDAEKALDLQIEHGCPYITSRRRSDLLKIALPKCQPVSMPSDFVTMNVCHETYRDVMGNPSLVPQILAGHSTGLDLERLPGVAPDRIQTAVAYDDLVNPIDLLLRVAEFNREIVMSTQLEDADIFCSDGAEKLLLNKLARAGAKKPFHEGFLALLDLTQVPDIREAIAAHRVSLADIWGMRQKPISARFRNWLRECETKEPRELEKAYVESISHPNITNAGVTRSLRFAITTTAGLMNPIAGILAGASDSFFVDKVLAGYKPKLFIDELRTLTLSSGPK